MQKNKNKSSLKYIIITITQIILIPCTQKCGVNYVFNPIWAVHSIGQELQHQVNLKVVLPVDSQVFLNSFFLYFSLYEELKQWQQKSYLRNIFEFKVLIKTPEENYSNMNIDQTAYADATQSQASFFLLL